MAGLLDQLTNMSPDQSSGLLAAASQILQQSGDPRRPFGLGQAMGAGIGGYQEHAEMTRRRKLEEAQAAQAKMLMGLQIQDKQSDFANQEATRKRASGLQALHAKFGQDGQSPGAQGPDMSRMNGPTLANAELLGQASAQQPSPAAANDLFAQKIGFAKQLRAAGYHPEADAEEEKALKFREEYSTTLQNLQGPDGKLRPYQVGKFGGVRDTGLGVAPEMVEMGLGNRKQWVDKNTVKSGQEFNVGVDPDTVYSGNISMRGQNMTDRRQRESNDINRQGQRTQIINDPLRGPLLVDKGTGMVRQGMGMDGQPIQGEAVAKKEASAKGLIPILDAAEKLIDGATGSYAGAALDEGARLFGGSTNGARNISQLKVIEGQIMMNQPRMEGPQSNMDVQLYRQMAGLIGDPTVPNSQKKAAFGTLREITARNAGGQAQPKAAAGQWSIKRKE